MTRPRQSPDRELFGILGSPKWASALQKEWNAYFTEKGIDATLTKYPLKNGEIPERLSEMFHFDRRAYIVDERLAEAVIPFLDSLDSSAEEKGSVSLILNENGVLKGFFFPSHSIVDLCQLFCL